MHRRRARRGRRRPVRPPSRRRQLPCRGEGRPAAGLARRAGHPRRRAVGVRRQSRRPRDARDGSPSGVGARHYRAGRACGDDTVTAATPLALRRIGSCREAEPGPGARQGGPSEAVGQERARLRRAGCGRRARQRRLPGADPRDVRVVLHGRERRLLLERHPRRRERPQPSDEAQPSDRERGDPARHRVGCRLVPAGRWRGRRRPGELEGVHRRRGRTSHSRPATAPC